MLLLSQFYINLTIPSTAFLSSLFRFKYTYTYTKKYILYNALLNM